MVQSRGSGPSRFGVRDEPGVTVGGCPRAPCSRGTSSKATQAFRQGGYSNLHPLHMFTPRVCEICCPGESNPICIPERRAAGWLGLTLPTCADSRRWVGLGRRGWPPGEGVGDVPWAAMGWPYARWEPPPSVRSVALARTGTPVEHTCTCWLLC
jgi:hypothetical protein